MVPVIHLSTLSWLKKKDVTCLSAYLSLDWKACTDIFYYGHLIDILIHLPMYQQ